MENKRRQIQVNRGMSGNIIGSNFHHNEIKIQDRNNPEYKEENWIQKHPILFEIIKNLIIVIATIFTTLIVQKYL